ncbi:MAG TPA: DUF4124 domain-containing protein [Gammaproteobacteria bacterium]|nr:DUF4124 domain-containing protein [Gammaproteobacteria bacterium]
MRIALLAIVTVLAPAAAQAAEVYRSVDAQGNVSYSDRPVDQSSEVVFVATPRPATPPAAPPAEPSPTSPTALDGEPAAPESEAPAEPPPPTPEELAAQRTANCQTARERNERYQMSRRLFRALPDGEREYLSDAEIDAAKAAAAADVEKWCN